MEATERKFWLWLILISTLFVSLFALLCFGGHPDGYYYSPTVCGVLVLIALLCILTYHRVRLSSVALRRTMTAILILLGANVAVALYVQGREPPRRLWTTVTERTGQIYLGPHASGRAQYLEKAIIFSFQGRREGVFDSYDASGRRHFLLRASTGTPLEQTPPGVAYPVYTSKFWEPLLSVRNYDKRWGPDYQRYLYEEDVASLGWRPTPTWTGRPEIILLYTPWPIVDKKWFIRFPSLWVAFHGDGQCRRYTSAADLEEALQADEKLRTELQLPGAPYKVYGK